MMTVKDLDRQQMIELKQQYLSELSDEGNLNAVIYNKPELDETSEGISYDELARADELVSDEVIYDHFAGVDFSDEDFSETSAA